MLHALKQYIKENFEKEWNPVACMCDFERGFMSALDEHKIDMRGCKFHLIQAVKKRLRKLDPDHYTDKQSDVFRHLVECFHAKTVPEFNVALAAMFSSAHCPLFEAYFRSTWVGAGDNLDMAARWALAFQSKFQSFHKTLIGSVFKTEQDIVQEIHSAGTNNISEGRNNADRGEFQGKDGNPCNLFDQCVVIHRSLNKHRMRYLLHIKNGKDDAKPDTHVAKTTANRASKLL